MRLIFIMIAAVIIVACTPEEMNKFTAPVQASDTDRQPDQVAGAHNYAGDSDNSITIQAGDDIKIHNPDFTHDYVFHVVSITNESITLSTNEENITIRDNGGTFPYIIDTVEFMNTGYELPVGWARFTPLEKTPVAQCYSMQPGCFVVRL